MKARNKAALPEGSAPFTAKPHRTPLPESCRVICVDTALRPLKERGLKPDLVVALEAQHWNLRDFTGMGGWRLPVAMDLSSLPAVSGLLGGETYLFWTRWTELSIFERLSARKLLPVELPPLGSVGLSAVTLALRLCSGPVFTAGMDFSFTFDKYHCRGSPSHSENLRRHTRLGGLYPAAALRALAPLAAPGGEGRQRRDGAMKNYKCLFESEFAGTGRVFAIAGSGSPLAVQTLPYEAALREMGRASDGGSVNSAGRDFTVNGADPSGKAASLRAFIEGELGLLDELLAILKGVRNAAPGRLDSLLDSAGYLWAHFPDCAGRGGARPPSGSLGFLKRVRAEIEPFIKTWELALTEVSHI
jgi:hypothetical protein